MNERMGRNEICDCGSGKKYKKCCLIKDARSADEGEVIRKKLNAISSELVKKVMRYATYYNGEALKKEMLPVFFNFQDDLPDTVKNPLSMGQGFPHWFYFKALLEEGEGEPSSFAENYLKEKGYQLDNKTREYGEAVCNAYYSFYEVTDVDPGVSVTVNDLLLNKTYLVSEKMGSEQMYPGLIFFSGLLDYANIYTFVGLLTVPLKGNVRLELENLKQHIQEELDIDVSAKTIGEFEVQELLRACCMEIYANAYGQMPSIVNKDGQTFEFNEVDYEVATSKETILEKLTAILPPDDTPKSLLAEAKNGVIEFPWLDKANPSAIGYSVLGHITLDDKYLCLETNATNRSTKLEVLLEDYLQGDITKIKHQRESLSDAMRRRKGDSDNDGAQGNTLSIAELDELQQEVIKRHWENWVDESIPALDNFTPREATSDPRMRKKLEALLLDFENDTRGHCSQKDEINCVRRVLGLAEW